MDNPVRFIDPDGMAVYDPQVDKKDPIELYSGQNDKDPGKNRFDDPSNFRDGLNSNTGANEDDFPNGFEPNYIAGDNNKAKSSSESEESDGDCCPDGIDPGAAIVAAGLSGATTISIAGIGPQGIVLEPAALVVAVGSIIAGTAVSLWYNSGNVSYPGPWTKTYQHPSQNPINNSPNKWDPKKPNWNDKGKLVKAIGVGGTAYQLHKKWKETSGDNLKKYKKDLKKEKPQFVQGK